MNRPTFVTMSTLVFTIVAYVALSQTAHAGNNSALAGGIDSREVPPSGAFQNDCPLAYNHGNATCLIGDVADTGRPPAH
jgi:hypothetical protein